MQELIHSHIRVPFIFFVKRPEKTVITGAFRLLYTAIDSHFECDYDTIENAIKRDTMAANVRVNVQSQQEVPPGMQRVSVPSTLPYYAVGAMWILYALMFPMYRILDYVIITMLSAGAFFVMKKVLPCKTILQPIPYEPAYTGDAAADAMLKDGQAYIAKFREANTNISDQAVKRSVERVTLSAQSVLDHIAAHPEKAKQVRRFIQYYMPTVQKMLEAYDKLEEQRTKGENIRSTMNAISQALDKVADAFDKQLDALFQNEAIDINADIRVLEGMLKQEGLSEGILDSNGGDAKKDEIELKL